MLLTTFIDATSSIFLFLLVGEMIKTLMQQYRIKALPFDSITAKHYYLLLIL